MERDKNAPENDQDTNKNANSAYSGSAGMQSGAGTGEAGRLNDYTEEEDPENPSEGKNNPNGKSIAEATDPSKLSDI